MLRIREFTNSASAVDYYCGRSDYYLDSPGEWIGQLAERQGLRGDVAKADFERVCRNISPLTGESLTVKTVEGRRVGWDFNFNSTKSVGLAREIIAAFDPEAGQRIEDAHREAVSYALQFIEDDMCSRVRVGGKDEDRNTGNLLGMRTTHRTTRASEDDHKPDMELHEHVFIVNATADDVEGGKIKACQIGDIKHDAPYYEAIYHNRMGANLRELGYGIRRKGKAFEISGISDALIERFSRRTAHIEQLAEKLGITSATAKDKLGATSRLGKSECVEADLTDYWVGRLSPAEQDEFTRLKGQPDTRIDVAEAVAYAIEHVFERQSVVDDRRLYETAIRRGIGSVTPEAVEAEAVRQGLLLKDGQATTQAVLDQEARLIAFGRGGRGCWQPLAADGAASLDGLSVEQQQAVRHVWESPDQVIMIRGGAGTGKTRMMTQAVAGIEAPVVVLAPSAGASRGVLRQEGFGDATTVAAFLDKPELQAQARQGVIWIDEAGLLSTRQLDAVFAHAKHLGARVVLQGDKRQHAAVERSATLQVLEDYAGLPVAELTEVRRQTHEEYKNAVAAIAKGDVLGGYDRLDQLGWIERTPETDHNKPLVDAYLAAVKSKASVLVVAPSHKEINEITGEIRDRLKQEKLISGEEKSFATLRPVGLTTAERRDMAEQGGGSGVVQFVRNSGPYKAGHRLAAAELPAGVVKPEHFAVYQPDSLRLAKGDTIRITANGRDKTGRHELINGATHQIAGFDRAGDIKLANGWVIDKTFAHMTHGLAVTSHSSQGKTVDRVLIAMGSESEPVISREQFYVSVSRGRHRATVFSDMAPDELRKAIERGDGRISATELMGKAAKPPEQPAAADGHIRLRGMEAFIKNVQATYRQLHEKADWSIPDIQPERQAVQHER